MKWTDLDLHPTGRKLRQFASLWAALFSGLTGWALFQGRGPDLLIGLAAVGLLGVVVPTVIKPIYLALTLVTFPIGWVVSRVLLAVVFYLVFTPIGLLLRLRRHDPLGIQSFGSPKTGWQIKKTGSDPGRYLRQF